jgi:hypothetical protein
VTALGKHGGLTWPIVPKSPGIESAADVPSAAPSVFVRNEA